MLGVERQRDPGLTHGWSPWTAIERRPACGRGSARERPREQLERARSTTAGAIPSATSPVAMPVAPAGRGAVGADDQHGGAGRDQLPGEPQVEVARARLGGEHRAAQARGRPARAGRAGTAPSAATRPGSRAASLSVSAPISAAARDPPRPSRASTGRPPSQSASAGGVALGVGQQPLGADRGGLGVGAAAAGSSPASARVTAAIITSVAANVIVEGPCSSPPRVSRFASASRASELVAAVRHRRDPGPVAALDERARRPHGLGALAGLADADEQRPRVERVQAEVQELGRVDHRSRARRPPPAGWRPGSRRRRSCPSR